MKDIINHVDEKTHGFHREDDSPPNPCEKAWIRDFCFITHARKLGSGTFVFRSHPICQINSFVKHKISENLLKKHCKAT